MATKTSMQEILGYVQNCNYPTDLSGVVQCARQNHAPDDVVKALEEMKDASSRVNYNSPADVQDEVERHRRHVSH